MSDPVLSLDAWLKVIEIISIIGGGALVVFSGGRVAERVQGSITALQEDVRKLNELVTKVAIQNQRIDMIEKVIDDLRRGEGYVLPLDRSIRVRAAKE